MELPQSWAKPLTSPSALVPMAILKIQLQHYINFSFHHQGTWHWKLYHFTKHHKQLVQYQIMADSMLAPNQWETSLQCNAVSHWLGAGRPDNQNQCGQLTWTWVIIGSGNGLVDVCHWANTSTNDDSSSTGLCGINLRTIWQGALKIWIRKLQSGAITMRSNVSRYYTGQMQWEQ